MSKEKDKLSYDTGYGMLKREIMRSKNISGTAKLIYAYFISFAGTTKVAYPSQDLICEELGITKKTLKKYLSELKDIGLIKIKQVKSERGTFDHNSYMLMDKFSINPIVEECEEDEEAKPDLNKEIREEIIQYLNKKTGKRFNPNTVKTKGFINGRIGEGYTLNDFILVIDTKCSQWLGNSRMEPYLRPSTLFCESNFENYINEDKKGKSTWNEDIGIVL